MIGPRRAIADVLPYPHSAVSRMDKVRLDLNENNWGCSPRVVEALRGFGSNQISIYPEYAGLTDKLAERLGVSSDNILLTNGADDAIRCITEAYLENGQQVVLPVPTFPVYAQYCKLREAAIEEVPFHEDLSYPVEGILKAISPQTSMVVLVNPNNPTGTCLTGEQLKHILDAASHAVAILDEAYCDYAGETHVGLARLYPNLMVLRTFSKAYGLAGLRAGYIVSAAANIDNLQRVNPPFAVNCVAVKAAEAALEDQDWLYRVLQEVRAEKEFLRQQLRTAGVKSLDTRANFILIRTALWTESIKGSLANRGILVKSLRGCPPLDGYVRVSVGRREDNVILLDAMRDLVRNRAVLFDMDGVLVDVSNSYRWAIKRTAEYFLGAEVDLSEIERYKHAGGLNNDWDLTAALIAAGGKEPPREELVEVFQRHYLGGNFDGLIRNDRWLLRKQSLEQLSEDFALGIVTGRPRAEAEYALEAFEMADLFGAVVAMEDVPAGRGKPDPYGIETAMKKLGAQLAVYVGDTVDDMKAATLASAIPVGVVGQGALATKQRRLLEEHGAQVVLDDVNDIVEVLK